MFNVVFLLCLSQVFACDEKVFTGTHGVIDTFGQKPHPSAVCTYTIRAPSSTRATLIWRIFDVNGDMPHCYGDYVRVRVGCGRSQEAGKFCTGKMNTLPHAIYSRDGCISISYLKRESGGFSADFATTAVSTPVADSCSEPLYIYSLPAVIASPGWPDKIYPASCKWNIRIGMKKKKILLNIMDINGYSFQIDYCYDKGSLDITTSYKQRSFHYCEEKEGRRLGFSTKDIINYYELDISFYNKDLRDNRGFVIGMVAYDKGDAYNISRTFSIIVPIVVVIVIAMIIGLIILRKRQRQAQQQRIQSQPMVVTGSTTPATQANPTTTYGASHTQTPSNYPVQNQQPYQQPPPFNPSMGSGPNGCHPNPPPVTVPPPAYGDIYPPK